MKPLVALGIASVLQLQRIYRKSEGLKRECYALRCNDYDIEITDTVRGEGYDIFATFSKWGLLSL